jgi:hypothetical protein
MAAPGPSSYCIASSATQKEEQVKDPRKLWGSGVFQARALPQEQGEELTLEKRTL